MMASRRRRSALHCSGSSRLFCNVIQFLAIAAVSQTCQALTGPFITLGSQTGGTTTSATVSFTPAAVITAAVQNSNPYISITLSGNPTVTYSLCTVITPSNPSYTCSASMSVVPILVISFTGAALPASNIVLKVHEIKLAATAQPAMTSVAAQISGVSSPESSASGTFPAIYTPGNWQLDSGTNIWTSVVPPNGNFPSSSALPLILDATARIIVAPATALGTNNPNYVTFGAGEAIMLPLCYPSYSAGTTADPSQDSKITFDTSATITVSLLNSSTGNLTMVIPTQSIGTNARVLNGFLKVSFPTDVYATGCMMLFTLTKLQFAPDIICSSISAYIGAVRAGSDTWGSTNNNNFNPYPLINDQSRLKYPFVAMASFSDTRPSRPTSIRITSQNSLMRGSFSCSKQLADR
jgi:hypothetical protein